MIPFPFQTAQFGRAASNVASGGDPNYSSVSLLLHGDGTNLSTVFTDNSPSPKTVTGFADAKISTVGPKYGTACIALDGTGDYLQIPDNAAFDFGTGNFTVETWAFTTIGGLDRGIISKRTATADGWALEVRATGAVWLRAKIGTVWSDTKITTATGLVTTDVWTHIALVRNGNDWSIYIDGTNRASITDTGALANMATALRIGRSADTAEDQFNGRIDELRITKGVARYTANFTPPAAAFPDS